MSDLHIGRAWVGHRIEDACPCPQAACGLVLDGQADPACSEHATSAVQTMRQRHRADRCPGPRTPKEKL